MRHMELHSVSYRPAVKWLLLLLLLFLPPGRGDIPTLTRAEAGTQLSDPRGMQAE